MIAIFTDISASSQTFRSVKIIDLPLECVSFRLKYSNISDALYFFQ